MDATWVNYITPKITNVDISRLRGGHQSQPQQPDLLTEPGPSADVSSSKTTAAQRSQAAVEAARARFLARKAGRP